VSSLGTEAKPIWFELAVQEYNALREEILTTMGTQDGTLRFGAATVGIVLTGAFNVWNDRLPAALVLLVVVPFLCMMVLIVWLGEVTRMMRAGKHVENLEKVFEALTVLPRPVMRWERNLRDPNAANTRWARHYEWNYLAIIFMFWSLGVVSVVAGVYRAIAGKGQLWSLAWIWIAAGVLLGVMTIGLFLTLRKLATVCETAGRLRCLTKLYWADFRESNDDQRASSTRRRNRARSAGR
jgi:hypothetical protein